MSQIADSGQWLKPDPFSNISLWEFDSIQFDPTTYYALKGYVSLVTVLKNTMVEALERGVRSSVHRTGFPRERLFRSQCCGIGTSM